MKDWFPDRAARNEAKKCLVDSCFKHRHKVSGYCRTHERQKERYGHPLGRAIQKRDYMREQEDVMVFMEKYSEHPTMKSGVEWFNSLLAESATGRKVPGKLELNGLIRAGVEGKTCLHAVLSIWLYSERRPGILPDDLRLNFAIAHALLGTAPRVKISIWKLGKQHFYYKQPSHGTLKGLGRKIREAFAAFTVNAFSAIHSDLAKEDEIINGLRKPFKTEAA